MNAMCSNSKRSSEPLKGSAHNTASFLIQEFFLPHKKTPILYQYSFRIHFPQFRGAFSFFFLSSGCAVAKAWSFGLCFHKELRGEKEFHCCKTIRVKTPISFPALPLDKGSNNPVISDLQRFMVRMARAERGLEPGSPVNPTFTPFLLVPDAGNDL